MIMMMMMISSLSTRPPSISGLNLVFSVIRHTVRRRACTSRLPEFAASSCAGKRGAKIPRVRAPWPGYVRSVLPAMKLCRQSLARRPDIAALARPIIVMLSQRPL